MKCYRVQLRCHDNVHTYDVVKHVETINELLAVAKATAEVAQEEGFGGILDVSVKDVTKIPKGPIFSRR